MASRPSLDNFRLRVLRRTREVYVSALKEFTAAVVADTPVLTGQLKANWRFSVDSPDTSPANSTADPTPKIASVIENSIVTYDRQYYFTNPMPYANKIEYGGSPEKAPDGMLRKNLVRFKGILRQRIK